MVKLLKKWGCLAVVLMLTSNAHAQETALNPHPTPSAILDNPDNDGKVYWPMLKGESLTQLANKLYPDSPILKKRFIVKTLSYSREIAPDLEPDEPFESVQMLIIPNEKAVRELTHKIKRLEDIDIAAEQEKLKLTYTLKNAPKPPPVKVIQVVKESSIVLLPAQPSSTEDQSTVKAPQSSALTPSKVQSQPTQPAIKQQAKLPEFELPKVQMGTISFPKIEMPELDTTNIKNSINQFWQNVSINSRSIAQQIGVQLSALQQSTNNTIKQYQGKNMTQIMSDYRLRNSLLLSLLGVLVVGLLIFFKLHAKQKVNSLGEITETLRNKNEAEFTINIPKSENQDDLKPMVYEQNNYH